MPTVRPDNHSITDRMGVRKPRTQGITHRPHRPPWSTTDTPSAEGADEPGEATRSDVRSTPGHR